MKRLSSLLGLISILVWGEASAAVTLVQKITNVANNGTSVSATLPSAPTPNDLLVVIASNRDASTTGPTTPAGWSVAISQANNSPGQVIFYKIAGAGESATVSIGGYVLSTRLGLQVFEYRGIVTSSPLDKTASGSGTGTPISTGNTATTSQANELLIAGVVVNTDTSLSGWGNSFNEENDFADTAALALRSTYGSADRIVSAAGTYSTSATAGSGAAWRGQIVTFKAAAKSRFFLTE